MKNYIRLWPGLLIFCISVIISVLIYQDYGLGSDEHGQWGIGERYYQYVFHGDSTFNTYIERDHGAGFELPLKIIEKKFHIADERDVYLMRHIVSHLFFLVCMFFSYILVLRVFNNQWLACLAYLMLIYHPRLFSQAFFNSKDIPSMGTFLVAIALARWAFVKNKPIAYILLGIAIGYSASIRLMNIIILPPILLFCAIDLWQSIRNKRNVMPVIINTGTMLAGFAIALYVCWPTLWGNPVKNLMESYESLSVFRWNGAVRFAATKLEAADIPWSYIPTWFVISTPEVWLLLGLIGIILISASFIDAPMQYFTKPEQRIFLLALFCFIAPIAVVILLDSVLYDDWRHLYFIYPSFVLLAMYGLNHLLKKRYAPVVWGFCVLQLLLVGRFMIKAHPYQYVYFNYLLSHKEDYLMKEYELDYWGVSNKDGLEWVLAHSDKDTIYINGPWILGFNRCLLTPEKRKRFVHTDDESLWDYHIENFRMQPYKYSREQSAYNIDVLNSPILRVTKLK